MATFNVNQSNYSVSNENLLWKENENMAKTLIPAMAFVGVIMVIGFFGNFLVCYIFTRRIPLSVNTFLLVILAALDLVNCTLNMPFEIIDLRYFYVFESDIACKIFRFLVAFPNIDSTFVLLIITVDRYKRVCRPMSIQMTFKDARKYVAIATAAAILLSLPAVLIYGTETVKTSMKELYGQDCKSTDKITGTAFRFFYQVAIGLGAMLISAVLCYIYVHIWREIRTHEINIRKKTQFVLMDTSNSTKHSTTGPSPGHQSEDIPNEIKGRPTSRKRITFIAFTVTSVFISRSVPEPKWPLDGLLSRILIRFYYLNSMTNPFVYGFMSKRFRRECFKVFVPKCLVCYDPTLENTRARGF
ncbi:nematocin receptor 2-like [Haliotis rubra]|uniref:nematocin receptor 2-like n=1 Tax=Haliotis rubra TaxID=36100 RepID=UPI001EE5B821|nr:nematocin receptor 2-like [Haliotis rubra]